MRGSKWANSEYQTQKLDQGKEARLHAIEVRRAARLIFNELWRARAAARMCIDTRQWWLGDERPLTCDAWKEYGPVIIADLSDEDWLYIRNAIEGVDYMGVLWKGAVAYGKQNQEVPQLVIENIVRNLEHIELGIISLKPLTLVSNPTPAKPSRLPPV